MDRALTELAEASVGLNSELSWTLSEDISRRQVQPVFERCASGELTPEQALDVCMDCMRAKTEAMMKIFDGLFTRLCDRLSDRYGDTHFQCILEMQEFFMGLDSTTVHWSNNQTITREELIPVFRRCASGELGMVQALDVFIDNMVCKRDYNLETIQDMVRRLALEIRNESKQKVGGDEDSTA